MLVFLGADIIIAESSFALRIIKPLSDTNARGLSFYRERELAAGPFLGELFLKTESCNGVESWTASQPLTLNGKRLPYSPFRNLQTGYS